MIKRVFNWLAIGVGAVVAMRVVLDAFGGHFLEGPPGPMPGGRSSGVRVSMVG